MSAKAIPIGWAILLSLAQFSAHAETTANDVGNRIASFVQGRFIAQAGAIYYAAKVKGTIDVNGELALEAEVDPLYSTELRQGPYGADGGVAYYDVSIAPNAECGPLGLPTRLLSTDISVRKGGQFINLRDALKDSIADLPSFHASYRPFNINEEDLGRNRACAKAVSTKIGSMPFEAIQVFAGQSLLAEVFRTTEKSMVFERDLGDEKSITHVKIIPKALASETFSVEVQAVSVMHCDYEGPHIELDNWKQGLSRAKPLRRKGNMYYVDQSMLDSRIPAFPAYTRKELRQAIGKHSGGEGMSSISAAKPCAPFLRGHRFRIKYGSTVVQEVSVYMPGGC